jgi:hypothetical protein
MFVSWEQLRIFDLNGAVSLPGWWVAGAAAFLVLLVAVAIMRGRAARAAIAFIVAGAGAWGLKELSARDIAAEARALEARAFELKTSALRSGSALACLDATADSMMRDSCEKALFASAESTAAAVSYVAAQVSLLEAGKKHAERSGYPYSSEFAMLRRALEADRFGIVAHLFAMRAGCGADKCKLLALLDDTGRVSANLVEQAFETHVKAHMADWVAAGGRGPGNSAPVAFGASPALAPSRPSSKLFFPSASSIPAVNVMTPEPPVQQPQETTASAEAAPRASAEVPARARKPPQAAAQPHPSSPVDSGQARSGPLQIAPAAQ